jgi:hypothetical protein
MMYLVLLLFFNLKLLQMKYFLTDNVLALTLNGCVGVFKAEQIAYIERLCTSRPANNRFKKGWLNRINDLKFAFFALVCCLTFCLTGCRSITSAKNTRIETVTHNHQNSRQLSLAVCCRRGDFPDSCSPVVFQGGKTFFFEISV